MTRPLAVAGTLLGLMAFLAALALFDLDVRRGLWDHDAGFFLFQSALLAAGYRPYLDFFPFYPPLMAAVNAVPLWFGADRLGLVVGLPVAWVAAVGLTTVACARRLVPGLSWGLAWGLGAGYGLFAVEFGGNHVTLEHAVVLCGLLAVLAFGPPQRATVLQYGLAGLACGLAVLAKQVGVVVALPFLLQVRSLGSGVAFGVGFALPLLGLLAYLGFNPAPLLHSGAQLVGYAAHGGQDGWWSALRHAKAHVLALPAAFVAEWGRATLGVLGTATVAAGGAWSLKTSRAEPAARLWVLAWLITGLLLLATRLVRDFPHYTLNCWVPLVVVGLAWLQRCGPGAVLRVGVAVLLVGAGVVTAQDASNPRYMRRFDSEGVLSTFIVPVAADVARLVPPGTGLVDVSAEEVLPFLAKRLAANRDWNMGPFGVSDVDRWVPPSQPCHVLTTPLGDPKSFASMDLALRASPRFVLVREWTAWGRHLRLYRRLPPGEDRTSRPDKHSQPLSPNTRGVWR